MLFSGSTVRSLDAKGRLILPPDIREALSAFNSENKVFLTRYYNRVRAYPVPIWQEIHEKLLTLESSSEPLHNFILMLTGYAEEVKIDNQGRINIPSSHIRFADLTHANILLGAGKCFEIWNETRYEEMISQMEIGEARKVLGTSHNIFI